MLLEDIKKAGEALTDLARPKPSQAKARVRPRKANAWRFEDDGLVPNHPAWPVIHYRGAVNLDGIPDPAAVFEVLFAAHGWKGDWRDAIYDYLHYHSDQHEVLGFARGHAVLRVGGARGRTIKVKAGDVVVLPAGTGHQRLSMSDGLLVVGAYPRKGGYDMCHPSKSDHDRAAISVARTPKPKSDPVYGKEGALLLLWRESRTPQTAMRAFRPALPEPKPQGPLIKSPARRNPMARKYSKGASKKVEKAMHERKKGTLKSGRSGKKVKSRKQAIAIGLSEARAEGKKVPKKKSGGAKKKKSSRSRKKKS